MCKPLMTLWYDRVVALYNQGLKQNEIVKELSLHKSQVSRYVARGKEEGVITRA